MGGTRNRFNRRFQQKNQARDEGEKPKYDKQLDFFDSITNSSLEQKRGGYRGRGRGGNRDQDAFGGRDNREFRDRDNYKKGDFNTQRGGRGGGYRGGRGGRNDGERRGRGGYDDASFGDIGNFRQNASRKHLYSAKLADPNDVNFGKEESKEGRDKNSGFYDSYKNAEDAHKAYERQRHQQRAGKDGREDGGFRGGRGGDRGARGGGFHDEHRASRQGERRGGGRGRGRGGDQQRDGQFVNTRGRGGLGGPENPYARNARRDMETFGEASAKNFKFDHSESKRGGRRQRKPKEAGAEGKEEASGDTKGVW